MRIGIIGAGHIGSTLAGLLVKLGHEVRIANSRGPDTLRQVAGDTGAEPVLAQRASDGADLVVLSIQMDAIADLSPSLFAELAPGVPLVDTCNYYPRLRDRVIPEIERGIAESRWVADRIGRPVTKAFNSITFSSLADKHRPAGEPGRIALPVAGDDQAATALVADLIDAIGFDPVDAGSLEESWRQQPGTPGYCTDLGSARLQAALALADRAAAPRRRDLFIEKMKEAFGRGGQPDLVELSREVYCAP